MNSTNSLEGECCLHYCCLCNQSHRFHCRLCPTGTLIINVVKDIKSNPSPTDLTKPKTSTYWPPEMFLFSGII